MEPDSKQKHIEFLSEWMGKFDRHLTKEQAVSVFGGAVQSLWHRSSVTLSRVTLMVVFDRALMNACLVYPGLSSIELDSEGVSMTRFDARSLSDAIEVREAFQLLMAEIISLVGVLTADILVSPLYAELLDLERKFKNENET